MLCEWSGAVIDGETGKLLKYRYLVKKTKYQDVLGIFLGNEIDRLAQGKKRCVKVTNKMSFIKKEKVPQNIFREVTYVRVVCDARKWKSDKNRTILTVDGDRIKYPDD